MHSVDDLLSLARVARRESRLDDARNYYLQAIARVRDTDRLSHISALTGLGQIERDAGNLDMARAHYEAAGTLCEDDADALILAHTVRHVGDILAAQGHLSAARSQYEVSLSLYRSNTETRALDLANALRSYALLIEKTSQPAVASPLWEEAQRLYASVHVEAGVEECNAHLNEP